MITILEYAQLSAHVYDVTKQLVNNTTKNTIASLDKITPKFNGWYRIPDASPNLHPSNSFYAQLYIKFRNGEAVDAAIAIRGTNSFANIVVDGVSWFSDFMGDKKCDHMPHYMAKAVDFYLKANRYLQNFNIKPHFPLTVTGHSLGGAIAQLLVLAYGYPTYAVAFNSPGVGDIPGVKQNLQNYTFDINAKYGFVNKIGKIIANPDHIYWIAVKNHETQAKKIFQTFDKKTNNKIRFSNLLESEATVSKMADVQKAEARCDKLANDQMRSGLAAALSGGNSLGITATRIGCKAAVLKNEYMAIVKDQHGIGNMITALMQTQYNGLAHANVPQLLTNRVQV